MLTIDSIIARLKLVELAYVLAVTIPLVMRDRRCEVVDGISFEVRVIDCTVIPG